MEAETLNCPMCGASAATDATCCEHCGARLATVACPSCFGMMFVGAKFCSHCGAKADRTETAGAPAQLCPRCQVAMESVVIGNTNLRECPRCEGIWADTDSLQQICNDREKQAAVLGVPAHLPAGAASEPELNIRYVPCPVCKKLMNRVNFAHCSHVVVDVCQQHGTWFDSDELRRIVEFIRAGGLEKSRTREIADLEQKKRELSSARIAGGADFSSVGDPAPKYDGFDLAISAAGTLLRALLR
jgi:Zn-finger nucleic acid-binding protein